MTTDLPKQAIQALLSDAGRSAVLANAVPAASETDLHSAFLHACEWDIAADIFRRLTAHADDIAIEKDDAEQRGRAQSGSVLQPASWHINEVSAQAARTLVRALEEEIAEAAVAVAEASQVRARIARSHEAPPTVPTSLPDARPPSPLETLIAFHHQLRAARLRVHALRTANNRTLQELALEEDLRERAAGGRDGLALELIDLYLTDDFFDLIADLSEGVPHPVPGYDGRDRPVTASLPDGQPVVFFPKHLPVVGHANYTPPPLPALGLPEVEPLSALARRHFPGAAVVVVTNGRFSATAQRYAQTSDVQLLGREGLERWATWSSPLDTVLGSCEVHTNAELVR
ncbi:hypothetical protein [Streptomyces violascens]|uniref:Restriction endonuclease type IV Mrr domain-containing protein n=1 Tax=Streptomyces violascens TaxID=67381 RepID=A0ABQ3QXQ4_9ACTN|nr:hypothetical protein [Streptomyces violascens]GGU18072.1 hypothetical protein GCM10010289_44650 [Streptomyces violascens]GHI42057.1 hypothetical protein Sviol_64650 [Streptomyces violascens]